jgi:hypothetical protein
VSEVVGALRGVEGLQEWSDTPPGGLDSALGGLAQQKLELIKDLLNRIEVGTVGRQEEQSGAGGANGANVPPLPTTLATLTR